MELERVLGGIVAAYQPRTRIAPETVAMYVHALRDLDPEELRDAAAVHMARSAFFPAISELRTLVAERRLDLPSLAEAREQLTRYDRDRTHPLVRKARLAVGDSWAWRQSERPEIMVAQAVKTYEELRREAIDAANLGGLALMDVPSLAIEEGAR